MDFTVIVTLGPAIVDIDRLKIINDRGNIIFRINGAHVRLDNLPRMIQKMKRQFPDTPIMIDLPGNKIRLSNLEQPIKIRKGEHFFVSGDQLNYRDLYKLLEKGNVLYANDSEYMLEVKNIDDGNIEFLSHSDGLLTSSKGLHYPGIYKHLPFLFEKDVQFIQIACEFSLEFISLSYVRCQEDVLLAKELLQTGGASSQIIAKIETEAALDNLEDILKEVAFINIDRGDLASDIGILKINSAIKYIVNTAKKHGKIVFSATQFLKNMQQSPVPSIPEVLSLQDYIGYGINGIQLSEETAIGEYPVECVDLAFEVHRQTCR